MRLGCGGGAMTAAVVCVGRHRCPIRGRHRRPAAGRSGGPSSPPEEAGVSIGGTDRLFRLPCAGRSKRAQAGHLVSS